MKEVRFDGRLTRSLNGEIKLLPILSVWLIALVSAVVFFIAESDGLNPVKHYFLVPWVILTAAVVAAPVIYLWSKNKFKIYHPLVHSACFTFVPAFIIGGLILANNWSEPYFLSLIQDPKNDLPFTMVIIMLGFAGLTFGYFLPLGKIVGSKIGNLLPEWNWQTEKLFVPCYVLLMIGLINTVFAYISGSLGYQKVDETAIFNGLIFIMTLLWAEASFLFWVVLFRRNKIDQRAVIAGTVLISVAIVKALYGGGRGGFVVIFITVMLAFFMAGRQFNLKQAFLGVSLLIISLIAGMIYGSTFRNLKGTEDQIGMGQYTETIFKTFDTIIAGDGVKNLEQGFAGLAERLDAVSSLAVLVSNYEQLAPYEESYGLDNNIWKDTITFIIPRVIWQNKPVASEPRKYSELYFNYGENSFIITPMGDLLRNFGVPGVFLGMVLVGFFLRSMYVAMIENKEFSYWRVTLYFMLLTSISYEGFYGAILPLLTKIGLISVIGLIIVHFVYKKTAAS